MNQSDLDTATLIRRLTEDLEACEARCKSQSQVASMNIEATIALRSELDETKARNERLCAQLAESIAQTERAIKQRDAIRHACDGAEAKKETFKSRYEAAMRDLDAKKAENESLRGQLVERDQKIEWQQGVIRTADSACVKIEQELAARRDADRIAVAAWAEEKRILRDNLATARRERDQHRIGMEHARRDELTYRTAYEATVKERDEAREQLAKVEWVSRRGPRECPICGHWEEQDHDPACWFAKQRATIPADTMAAGSQVRISVEFKPEPARPEPKFKVGQKVEYCGKTYSISGSTWHELFSCWAYTIDGFGCDISESSLVPAPRFSVGDWAAYRTEVAQIAAGLWDPKLGQWFYATNGFTNVAESALSRVPAPKFAVGEWVTWSVGVGEIVARRLLTDIAGKHSWIYDVKTNSPRFPVQPISEQCLTAQTPQHKHICAHCVFLGRDGDFDLYYDPVTHGTPTFLRVSTAATWVCDADIQTNEHAEARRRARLRGLIK